MSNPEPIIVSQSFNRSKEEVWTAITKRDLMVQWFFDNIPDFQAEVGFETQFVVSTGERSFTHLWEIIAAIPNQKIVYSWRYAEYPQGDGVVTFELADENDGCLLTVTAEGTESFPQDIPEFTRESGLGGWTYFIKEQLPQFLKK